MQALYSFIILCLMVCVVSGAKKQSKTVPCDNENRKKADVCADKLWFVGKNSRKYPESEQQMKKYCKQTIGLIKCAKDFTDSCAKGTSKQLANVMLYTSKMSHKSYCSKSSKREEIIDFSTCGNAIREQANLCMDNFLINLGKAHVVEDSKLRIPHACCAFHQLKSCIMKAAKDSGDSTCPEKKMDNYEKYINTMAGNTLNLMCTDYEEDSDKCTKLPGLPKDAKFTKAPTIIIGFGQLLSNV